jgi:hypothetical protein
VSAVCILFLLGKPKLDLCAYFIPQMRFPSRALNLWYSPVLNCSNILKANGKHAANLNAIVIPQSEMPMPNSVPDPTLFLNVDLDIHSTGDLQPLVSALGDKVIDLFVGRVNRHYEAHLELAASRRKQTPTWVIIELCKLIEALPPAKRKLWNAAKIRSFDIGIDTPGRNRYFWSAVTPDAIRAAARVDAQIAITVYGPMKPAQTRRTKPTAPSK